MIRTLLAATAAAGIIAMPISGGIVLANYAAGQAALERGDAMAALDEFRRAAESGDARAQFRLGQFYERGEPVLQDFVVAHMWYNVAGASGHAEASTARNALAERMTSEQVARAQEMARQRLSLAGTAPAPQQRDQQPQAATAAITTADVEAVQRRLNALGYSAGTADGVVGPRTRAALRSWQQDVDLPSTGVIDRVVIERLAVASVGPRPAQVASAAPPSSQQSASLPTRAEQVTQVQVRQVQLALREAGFDPGPVDGVMGSRTQAAIRDWQRAQGMPVTGEVTEPLLAAFGLHTQVAASPPPTRDPASTPQRRGGEADLSNSGRLSSYTTAIQEELAQHGYFRGRIGGELSGSLRQAIREYEEDAELPVTGQVSEDLLDHLKFARPEVIKQQRAGAR